MKLKEWSDKSRNTREAKQDQGTGTMPGADGYDDSVEEPDEGWDDSEPDTDNGWDEDAEREWEESGQEPYPDREHGRTGSDLDSRQAGAGEEGQWKEAALASKPNVAYKWKKVSLDSEFDEGQGEGKALETDRKGLRPDSGRHRASAAGEEYGPEEELAPLKPWAKVLVFLGLAVAAAIICALLWHFVHPDKPEAGDGQDAPTQTAGPPDESAQRPDLDLTETDGEESGSNLVLEPTDAPVPETGEEHTDVPASESESGTEADASPDPTAEPTVQEPEEQEPVAGTESMDFQAVQDTVTPKDVVNLRMVPTTRDADNIAAQAQNGETFTRIGINEDTGWSKVEYNGQTLYAVSQYLTTDLGYKPPVQPSDPNRVSTVSGRIIIFRDCDDWVSPKEYVNLRTEPSTTEGDATVSCQLNSGEKAHRTGYSTDSGWSRVEYNGQVLYVVTSLIYEVPAE